MIKVTVSKRGCGFPKEGGYYAIGGGRPANCFALPVELTPCACCNQMPKFARCPTPVTPEYMHMLFGNCEKSDTCNKCVRDKKYWISWVGSDYTADEFCDEVRKQGLSRRLPPSFAELIQPGDYFANVKSGKIISLVPITSVRYYKKPSDTEDKVKELENKGIEVAVFDTTDNTQEVMFK